MAVKYTVARGYIMNPPSTKGVAGNTPPLLAHIVHKYIHTL